MRCIAGLTLFVVLYFGSCKVLADVAGTAFVTKYHALVAVVVGLIALVACCLPTLLLKSCERNEAWRRYADDVELASRRSTDRLQR